MAHPVLGTINSKSEIRSHAFRVSDFVFRILRKPLFWIIFGALLFRLWGIDYALPQFFINDERATVYGALKMLELRTLIPAFHAEEFKTVLNYLPVSSYIFLIVLTPVIGIHYLFSGTPNLEAYTALITLDPTVIFLASRITIVFLGVGTMYLSYRIARLMFNERAGLWAAAFLAVSFYHIQLSQVTRHWMPALFMMTLAWFFAVRIYQRGASRDYMLGGISGALGLGANTAAGIIILPLFLSHFFRQKDRSFFQRLADPRLFLLFGTFLFGAVLLIAAWPYGLTQGETPGGTAAGTLLAKWEILGTKNFYDWLSFLWYYAKLFLTYETALFVAAIAGIFLIPKEQRFWAVNITLLAVSYLTLLYLFFNIIPRGVLFLLPPAAILGGHASDWLARRVPKSVFFVIVALVLAWPVFLATRYAQIFARDDTRMLAEAWIYENIPGDVKILADLPYLRLANTREGIQRLQAIDPEGLRIQDRTLLQIDPSQYPQPSREVLNLHFIQNDSPYRMAIEPDFFIRQGYRYLVIEYEYRNGHDLEPQIQSLRQKASLIERFDPWGTPYSDRALDISGEIAGVSPFRLWRLERFGPIVDIYFLGETVITLEK